MNLVGDLKGDAVAIVVPSGAVFDRYVAHVIHVDGSPAAPIEVGILGLISVYDQIFESNVLGIHSAQNRESVANASMLLVEVIVSDSHRADLKNAPVNGNYFRDADIPSVFQDIIHQLHPHAGMKLLRLSN